MRRLVLCVILFLLLIPPADAFERSKLIVGNFTNPIRAEIPHEYRAEWIEFIFSSNETCNASPTYRVYQHDRIVKEGRAELRWFGNRTTMTVPLELYDEFTLYLTPNFSCKAVPLEYRIFATIDFKRLTRLEVKTEKAVRTQWKGKPVKNLPLMINFNISGELLGIEAELYDYRGKLAQASLSWNGVTENFTVPVVDGRTWIPGKNASGKVLLGIDVSPNVFVSATAYYLIRRRPVNDDLLFKDGNLIRFDYPLGGMMWDEGTVGMWFRLNGGDSDVLAFDFGKEKVSKLYTDGDNLCVLIYPPYGWRTKRCVLIPEKRIHNLQLSLIRNPDGTRHLHVLFDGMRIFEKEVDSGIRLWYLGGKGVDVLSFDASLRRNPDYYVVPSDERKTDIALGISLLAIALSLLCLLRLRSGK
ncbi:hypothetical protein JCM16138_16880 [Thermococcus atlanticus]